MSEKIKRMELPKYKKEKKRMELPKYKKEKKRSRMAELLIRRAKGIDREASGRKRR